MSVPYTIFTEPHLRRPGYRKLLIPGCRIRVDCPTGQFHKIRRLHRCANWRVLPDLGHTEGGITTRYLEILSPVKAGKGRGARYLSKR